MDEVKLLPCPFCASKAIERQFSDVSYLAGCSNDDCPVQPEAEGDSEKDARERWNTRAEPARPSPVTDEVVERVAEALFERSKRATHTEQGNIRYANSVSAWWPFARAAIAAMPAIPPQSLGAIPGSHPTGQAPSGLGASRFDPERG